MTLDFTPPDGFLMTIVGLKERVTKADRLEKKTCPCRMCCAKNRFKPLSLVQVGQSKEFCMIHCCWPCFAYPCRDRNKTSQPTNASKPLRPLVGKLLSATGKLGLQVRMPRDFECPAPLPKAKKEPRRHRFNRGI